MGRRKKAPIDQAARIDYQTRMKRMRLERTLRLGDIARELGMSESAISRIERGSLVPSDLTKNKLSAFYGCGFEELMHPAEG